MAAEVVGGEEAAEDFGFEVAGRLEHHQVGDLTLYHPLRCIHKSRDVLHEQGGGIVPLDELLKRPSAAL
jgi:hypothetical protein